MNPTSSLKEIINPGNIPSAPYSRIVKAAGLIYLSGTRAQDDAGAVIAKGDVAAQTHHVLERMRDLLRAAGSSLEQVVAVTVYLTSASDFQTMNGAYRPFWPKDPPTRTTVVTGLVVPDALVEISMVAVPNGAARAVVHPDTWMKSPNPYSYGVRAGDTVFLSGLVSRKGPDNSLVAGDVSVQTRIILENADELLNAAGLTIANVVSARVYLTDAADFAAMNAVYREFFPANPPARATVKAALAGAGPVVEITLIASAAPRQAIGTPPPGVPISPAVRAGDRLYVSGMLANSAETAGDVAAQTRGTLEKIGRTLADAGATPADVVDGLVYVTDAGAFAAMNEQYRTFFGREFPARATVVTPLVAGDALVEIMVTAAIQRSSVGV